MLTVIQSLAQLLKTMNIQEDGANFGDCREDELAFFKP